MRRSSSGRSKAVFNALHSYQTPEFLVLGIEAASEPYLAWLTANLRNR